MALATSRLSPARLIEGAESIDGSLLYHRRLTRVSWIGLTVAALAEAIAIIAFATAGEKNTSALDRLTENWIFVAGLTLALLSLALLALGRLWVREAQEAFRYTCSLGDFTPVTPEDAERLPFMSERLRHDVGRRLSERIARLTFIDPEIAAAQTTEGRVPHLHVCGHFLLREGADGMQTLEVVPRVRIGSAEAGEALAAPAEIRLESAEFLSHDPLEPIELDPDTSERIVERVYFSLATEIYRQIRTDVSRKIDLLPTRHLRATAYLIEAEDYAHSNTLNAYEAARDLFLRSMTLYDSTWVPLAGGSARRAVQQVSRTNTALRTTVGQALARASPRAARRIVLIARAEVGYADMLLSTRTLAGLSGRRLNPIFLARPVAEQAVQRLETILDHTEGARPALFNARVVLASACEALDWPSDAVAELARARGVDPLEADNNPRYVLALASTHQRLRSSLPYLRRAVELDPRSEVAQFQLARQTELFWRTRSSLEPSVARHAIEEYKRVLKINPSNVRAWANIGYIQWLLGNGARAREAYERARKLKDTLPDIYIADVDFGLARLAAEDMDVEGAYQHYIEGMAAIISQGAVQVDHDSPLFELISPAMVDRFFEYHDRVLEGLDAQDRNPKKDKLRRIRQSIRAFVRNDYGLALHSLWERTGDDRWADRAAEQYKEARKANADFVIPYYLTARLEATRHRYDEAQRYRMRIEALEPDWREGQMLGCLIDAWRANNLEREADQHDRERADALQLENRLGEPVATATDDSLEVSRPAALGSDVDLRPRQSRRLLGLAHEKRERARELRAHASGRIIELFPYRDGKKWPWGDDDFDWTVLEQPRRKRREERELRWEREFDNFLLFALSAWLLGRASAFRPSSEEITRLLSLARHLTEHFSAEPLVMSAEEMLVGVLVDQDPEGRDYASQRKAVEERYVARNVAALERDPIDFQSLEWLVYDADGLVDSDMRRALLEHAAARAQTTASHRLAAEGLWSIGEYGHALENLRAAAVHEEERSRRDALKAEHKLRAAVYRSGVNSVDAAVEELEQMSEQRPAPGVADGWRVETVRKVAERDIPRLAQDQLQNGPRAQRMLSMWLEAEHRRVATEDRGGGRADVARAQVWAAVLAWDGPLALPVIAPEASGNERLIPLLPPIRLACDESLFPGGPDGPEARRVLDEELPRVRTAVKQATGISIPGVTVGTEPGFEPGGYRILHEETQVRVGTVADEADPYGALAAALEDVLRPLAWRFFDVDEAAKLLTELEHGEDVSNHELARRVIRRDRTAAVILVSGVVQALLQDGVKAELATVLDVVAARSSHDSVGVLTERARFALRREIPSSADPGRLVALDEAYEADISRRVERVNGIGALAIDEGELQGLVDRMAIHVDGHPEPTTIIVRMPGLRPHVQEVVRTRWADVPVIAAHELLDQWWDPTATVQLAASTGGNGAG